MARGCCGCVDDERATLPSWAADVPEIRDSDFALRKAGDDSSSPPIAWICERRVLMYMSARRSSFEMLA